MRGRLITIILLITMLSSLAIASYTDFLTESRFQGMITANNDSTFNGAVTANDVSTFNGQINATQQAEFNGVVTFKSLVFSNLALISTGAISVQNNDITVAGAGQKITSPEYCIGGSCITSWPAAPVQPWTVSGSDIYYNTGNVGIGTTSPSSALDVSGNVRATAFIYSSDRRLKENIVNIEDASEKVSKLNGVTYDWKDSGKADVGLIAQEVQAVLPEAVHETDNGYLAVDYPRVVALLVGALNEQQAEIDSLKEQLNK